MQNPFPPLESGPAASPRASLREHWPIFAVAALLCFSLRALALEVPLERDEGEYAYMAQRLLAGEVPYRDVFNQKPPGIFLAYLPAVWVAGTSVAAIHITAAIWTLWGGFFLFLIVRSFCGARGAALSLLLYSVLTICPEWQALAANTEIFMLTPILGATWCLLRAWESSRAGWWFGAGICAMLAALFKQVAMTHAAWLALWSLWEWRRRRSEIAPRAILRGGGLFLAGFCGTAALVLALFALRGAGQDFLDCVLWHNLKYSRQLGWAQVKEILPQEFRAQGATLWGFWLLTCGAMCDWRAAHRRVALFLTGWLVCALLGVSVGFYFRPHYFVQLAPVFAFAAAVTLDRLVEFAWKSTSRGTTAKLTAALGVVALLPWAVPNFNFWLRTSPAWKSRALYGQNPFPESAEIARQIRVRTEPQDRILIFGSEPQILFLAERRSATRYILFYPLLMDLPETLPRQEVAFHEIQQSAPQSILLTNLEASLLPQKNAPRFLNEQIRKILDDYHLVGFRQFDNRRRQGELVFQEDAEAELQRRQDFLAEAQGPGPLPRFTFDMLLFVKNAK